MENDLEEIQPLEAIRAMWLSGILNWKLHDAQLVIDACIANLPQNVKEAVVLCCRRFGKSFYGVLKAVEICLRATHPKMVRIIGPEIKQTEMIVGYNMGKIISDLPSLGLHGLVNPVKSEKKYEVGKFGHIFLGGFDSQEDSLRGGEAHEILIEESGFADPDQYNYQMKEVLKPQLLKTRGRMIHLTTLPKIPGHPFIKETIPKAKLNNSFYSYTIYEDPLATPDIINDAIEDCGGINTDAFKREYLNIVVREKSVVIIPDFDRKKHVRDFTVPKPINLEIFTDNGGTRDFTVALLMGHSFLEAVDLVIDELWWPNNTNTEIITRDIKEAWYPGERIRPWANQLIKTNYWDAHGQTRIDIGQIHDMDITTPAKDDWESNVNNMAVRFTKRKILIHPRCTLTIETCDSGTFNKNRTDFDRTEALGHMDAAAALMYGIRNLDRSSPYTETSQSSDNHFIPQREEDKEVQIIPFKSFSMGQRKVFK